MEEISKIQHNVLLLGKVEEDGDVSEDPIEKMLSILECQNEAQVYKYLRQAIQGRRVMVHMVVC